MVVILSIILKQSHPSVTFNHLLCSSSTTFEDVCVSVCLREKLKAVGTFIDEYSTHICIHVPGHHTLHGMGVDKNATKGISMRGNLFIVLDIENAKLLLPYLA